MPNEIKAESGEVVGPGFWLVVGKKPWTIHREFPAMCAYRDGRLFVNCGDCEDEPMDNYAFLCRVPSAAEIMVWREMEKEFSESIPNANEEWINEEWIVSQVMSLLRKLNEARKGVI